MDSGAVLTLGYWSATNADNYVINGGLLSEVREPALQLFHLHHHDRRHDRRRHADGRRPVPTRA